MDPEGLREPESRDYYRDLGIERTATYEEIKLAFHRLALHYHPDKKGDADEFRKIWTAYEVLREEELRAGYDKDYATFHLEWVVYDFRVRNYKIWIKDEKARREAREVARWTSRVQDSVQREAERARKEELERAEEQLNYLRQEAEEKRQEEDRHRAGQREAEKAERMRFYRERREREREERLKKGETNVEDAQDDEELELGERSQSQDKQDPEKTWQVRQLDPAWKEVFAFQKYRTERALADEMKVHDAYSESRGLDFTAAGLDCPCWGCVRRDAREKREILERDMGMRYWQNRLRESRKREREEQAAWHDYMMDELARAQRKKEIQKAIESARHQQAMEAARKTQEKEERKKEVRPERMVLSPEYRQLRVRQTASRKQNDLNAIAAARAQVASKQRQAKFQEAEKVQMAHEQIRKRQEEYLRDLDDRQNEQPNANVTLDLGWPKSKAKQAVPTKCTFCDTSIPHFSFICPHGGATACKPCKDKLSVFMPPKPEMQDDESLMMWALMT
ncbi:hypothetical protein BDV96DRAFT_595613 [Lophiotrema nucula]|uniref:J domain-containing protein n=1 Tax=Lophiotrema nucula TaxID=690887 RepID=A0A6A5ZMC7_9PLEO|nr:hypothetical protein BDV96DRAFT_595613 [Lophiotrema nucula]